MILFRISYLIPILKIFVKLMHYMWYLEYLWFVFVFLWCLVLEIFQTYLWECFMITCETDMCLNRYCNWGAALVGLWITCECQKKWMLCFLPLMLIRNFDKDLVKVNGTFLSEKCLSVLIFQHPFLNPFLSNWWCYSTWFSLDYHSSAFDRHGGTTRNLEELAVHCDEICDFDRLAFCWSKISLWKFGHGTKFKMRILFLSIAKELRNMLERRGVPGCWEIMLTRKDRYGTPPYCCAFLEFEDAPWPIWASSLDLFHPCRGTG